MGSVQRTRQCHSLAPCQPQAVPGHHGTAVSSRGQDTQAGREELRGSSLILRGGSGTHQHTCKPLLEATKTPHPLYRWPQAF